jgi:hypothetical protein
MITQKLLNACKEALGYGLDDRVFESRHGLGIFLLTTASRPALWPTQPPIQRTPGALTLKVKQPGREADQPHPSSAGVKNAWSYTSTPPICLHGVMFIYKEKLRDNFTFTFKEASLAVLPPEYRTKS